jgi:hypothetical protein
LVPAPRLDGLPIPSVEAGERLGDQQRRAERRQARSYRLFRVLAVSGLIVAFVGVSLARGATAADYRAAPTRACLERAGFKVSGAFGNPFVVATQGHAGLYVGFGDATVALYFGKSVPDAIRIAQGMMNLARALGASNAQARSAVRRDGEVAYYSLDGALTSRERSTIEHCLR